MDASMDASMDTILVTWDEQGPDARKKLKHDCATYFHFPEVTVHIMMMRNKDMVTIKNLDKAPIYVEQEDYVTCVLDSVLQKVTVHNDAKIYIDCKKLLGVWSKNADADIIRIIYPSTSPKFPSHKRKYTAQLCEEETDRTVNQAPART